MLIRLSVSIIYVMSNFDNSVIFTFIIHKLLSRVHDFVIYFKICKRLFKTERIIDRFFLGFALIHNIYVGIYIYIIILLYGNFIFQ